MNKTTIIANGVVLTCDAANRCGRYNILVSKGRILDISDRLETLAREHPDAVIVDAKEKLIVPGFVNAHYHGESFLLREVTNRLHFGLWKSHARLNQVTAKFTHESAYEDVWRTYCATYLAHLKSGTTCVGEFASSLNEDGFARMLEGIEKSAVLVVFSLQNWDQIRKVQAMGGKRPRAVMNLGREEEFTVYSFEHLSKAAKEMNTPLLAHIAETKDAVESVRENFHRDCITLLNAFNTLQPSTIIVHANHITEDEVMSVKNVQGSVVVCARSTAAKQTGYPSLRHLTKHGVRLCIGTDWGNTDMIEEMRFVYQLPLVVAGLRPFSAIDVLRMATINGAHALGVASEAGSIESGKRADFVFLGIGSVRLPIVHLKAGAEDWARILVEHLATADISDVMIHGEFKIRNNEATEVGERVIEDDFRSLHEKYFPPSDMKIVQQVHSEPKANVLPFIPERAQEEAGNFESGFSVVEKSAAILEISEQPAELGPTNSPKPMREPMKPELPKDTRRVFGEDEDLVE